MARPITSIQFSLPLNFVALLQTQSLPDESVSITAKRLLIDLLSGSLPTPTLPTASPTPPIEPDYQEKIQEKIQELEDKIEQLATPGESINPQRLTALESRLTREVKTLSERLDSLASPEAAAALNLETEKTIAKYTNHSIRQLEEQIQEKFTRIELWIKKVENIATSLPDYQEKIQELEEKIERLASPGEQSTPIEKTEPDQPESIEEVPTKREQVDHLRQGNVL